LGARANKKKWIFQQVWLAHYKQQKAWLQTVQQNLYS
jgi:hypothetical protein